MNIWDQKSIMYMEVVDIIFSEKNVNLHKISFKY